MRKKHGGSFTTVHVPDVCLV